MAGFAEVINSGNADNGAWQTYTILKEIVTMKIPDFMSFEEGAVFPMAFATATIAIYVNLGVPRPDGPIQSQEKGLLVWGASSSVGSAMVQLAKISGFKVYATAGPFHHR